MNSLCNKLLIYFERILKEVILCETEKLGYRHGSRALALPLVRYRAWYTWKLKKKARESQQNKEKQPEATYSTLRTHRTLVRSSLLSLPCAHDFFFLVLFAARLGSPHG